MVLITVAGRCVWTVLSCSKGEKDDSLVSCVTVNKVFTCSFDCYWTYCKTRCVSISYRRALPKNHSRENAVDVLRVEASWDWLWSELYIFKTSICSLCSVESELLNVSMFGFDCIISHLCASVAVSPPVSVAALCLIMMFMYSICISEV